VVVLSRRMELSFGLNMGLNAVNPLNSKLFPNGYTSKE
jgi:hypothetical protein